MSRGGMMMGTDGMMGRGGMKRMMQAMMGNMLPLGINPASLPQPHSEGARLMQHYCTQCHGLPGPGLHTAAGWPAVVARMAARERMLSDQDMWASRPCPQESRRRSSRICRNMPRYP